MINLPYIFFILFFVFFCITLVRILKIRVFWGALLSVNIIRSLNGPALPHSSYINRNIWTPVCVLKIWWLCVPVIRRYRVGVRKKWKIPKIKNSGFRRYACERANGLFSMRLDMNMKKHQVNLDDNIILLSLKSRARERNRFDFTVVHVKT